VNELLGIIFLFCGAFFIFIGSLGVLRFPDTLMRAHALSKALTLGITLMLIGTWVTLYEEIEGMKIFLAILFLFLTIPVAGHLLGFMAYRKEILQSTEQEEEIGKITAKESPSLKTRKIFLRKEGKEIE
jgi:multicomponent Na+:H+ antiporter subunit G